MDISVCITIFTTILKWTIVNTIEKMVGLYEINYLQLTADYFNKLLVKEELKRNYGSH